MGAPHLHLLTAAAAAAESRLRLQHRHAADMAATGFPIAASSVNMLQHLQHSNGTHSNGTQHAQPMELAFHPLSPPCHPAALPLVSTSTSMDTGPDGLCAFQQQHHQHLWEAAERQVHSGGASAHEHLSESYHVEAPATSEIRFALRGDAAAAHAAALSEHPACSGASQFKEQNSIAACAVTIESGLRRSSEQTIEILINVCQAILQIKKERKDSHGRCSVDEAFGILFDMELLCPYRHQKSWLLRSYNATYHALSTEEDRNFWRQKQTQPSALAYIKVVHLSSFEGFRGNPSRFVIMDLFIQRPLKDFKGGIAEGGRSWLEEAGQTSSCFASGLLLCQKRLQMFVTVLFCSCSQ